MTWSNSASAPSEVKPCSVSVFSVWVRVAGSPSRGSSISRCGSPSTWLRCASSSLASCSRLGTDGKKMLAVSPGRRDRTNRPMACAKYSGVEALVA